MIIWERPNELAIQLLYYGRLFVCFATLIPTKPYNVTCHIFDILLESSQWNEWVGGATRWFHNKFIMRKLLNIDRSNHWKLNQTKKSKNYGY